MLTVIFKQSRSIKNISTFLIQSTLLNHGVTSFQFLATKISYQNLFWESVETNSGVKELKGLNISPVPPRLVPPWMPFRMSLIFSFSPALGFIFIGSITDNYSRLQTPLFCTAITDGSLARCGRPVLIIPPVRYYHQRYIARVASRKSFFFKRNGVP